MKELGESLNNVRQFYDSNSQREWERLFVDKSHEVEYRVTMKYLQEFLPQVPARIADIGGGPGRYSIALANKGYNMSLVDISEKELALAREKIEEAQVNHFDHISQENILDLSVFNDEAFDAILALGGVVSHLSSVEDRQKAISELARIAKPNAPIFISVMSRLGEIGNRLTRNPEDVESLDTFLENGEHLRPTTGVFTYVHFFMPEELENVIQEARLKLKKIVSVQSISTPLRNKVDELPNDLYEKWLDIFIQLSAEPSLLGTSSHIMAIAKKE
jgi:ubiquinone/menaquinone biosynthesis C-methylase UbiE